MARTLKQLRQGIGQLIGLRRFYGTADATGSTASLVRDADAKRFPSGYFTGYWLLATSGTDAGKIFHVSNFTNTDGDFTLGHAASGAAVFDSATYEVYPFDPSYFTDAINKAGRALWPFVNRPVRDRGWVTGCPLWNPGFEEWNSSSDAVGWTASGLTLARSTTEPVWSDQYNARLTNGASGRYLGLTTAQRTELAVLLGHSVTFYAVVKTSTASICRLSIIDADATTNGSYHSGGGNWELLEVTRGLPDTKPDAFDLRINAVGAGTIDVGRAWTEGGPGITTYRSPATMVNGPLGIYVARMDDRLHPGPTAIWRPASFYTQSHEDANASTGRTDFILNGRAPSAYHMMLLGRDVLTELSADTDNAEVTTLSGELLETEAAITLLGMSEVAAMVSQHAGIEKVLDMLMRRREGLLQRVKDLPIPMPLPSDL